VPYAHDYRGLPIGRTEWVKIDSKTAPTALIAKTKYASAEANPLAEQVYLLHAEGILRAKSVGFIPITSKSPSDDDWVEVATAWRERRDAMLGHETKEADPRRIYTKWVLLEQSPVPVPSNPEALAMVVSKGIITMEEAIASGFVDEYPTDPISAEMAEKPYANEHACRLNDPGKYDKFARKNCAIKHDNKCIDVIYGIKGGKSEMQAYRYPKDIWTAATARKHCKDHEGAFEAAKDIEAISPETKAVIKDIFDDWFTTGLARDFDDRIKVLEAVYAKEEIIEGLENGESPEISDEDAQKILDMVSTRLTSEEDVELTVEELLEFHNTGLV